MPNQVILDPHGFQRHLYRGDQDSATVGHMVTAAIAIIRDLQKQGDTRPLNLLLDISDIGKQTLAARRAAAKALQTLPYHKIAVIGASPFMEHVADLIILSAHKQDSVKRFDSEADAVAWLDT